MLSCRAGHQTTNAFQSNLRLTGLVSSLAALSLTRAKQTVRIKSTRYLAIPSDLSEILLSVRRIAFAMQSSDIHRARPRAL